MDHKCLYFMVYTDDFQIKPYKIGIGIYFAFYQQQHHLIDVPRYTPWVNTCCVKYQHVGHGGDLPTDCWLAWGSIDTAVTRRLYYYSIFGHLQQWQFAQYLKNRYKSLPNSKQIIQINAQRLLKICQSSEIWSKLVTLHLACGLVIKKQLSCS